MGDILGKSSVIIIIILVALVVGVIFLPQLGQFTLRFGAETLTVVDTSAQRTPDSDGTIDLKMITILGRDGIPAILDPVFARQGAESNMEPAERVIGVSINGESRAYPINLMSRHEIVNDTVGARPSLLPGDPSASRALYMPERSRGGSTHLGCRAN